METPSMSKSYAEIIQQIEDLKTEAERMRRDEVGGVITRIKEAIAADSLTPADLGFGARRGRPPATVKPGRKRRKAAAAKPAARGPKFRDSNGNIWGGRGPRPRWLREALLAGRTLKDFAV